MHSRNGGGRWAEHILLFIGTLVALLFVGTWALFMENKLAGIPLRFVILPFLIILIIIEARQWFTPDEQKSWLDETLVVHENDIPAPFPGSSLQCLSVHSSQKVFSDCISDRIP